MRNNPQLAALALLIQRFGDRIKGGGFEVEVSTTALMEMSPHGTFQEVPSPDRRSVKWQYFPNVVINTEGHTVPDAPEAEKLPEEISDRPVRSDETVG